MFELTGNCVFSQSFSGNNTIELTSEDLSTGLYFITIHSEEGNFMKKLVVQ
ncbi:MAG: T9SS type A sorting domain-containing protein [Bacteroidetes bacterium]|nr:T9SS type A sorting domain-containing protein [Bacteroidota bacterium]